MNTFSRRMTAAMLMAATLCLSACNGTKKRDVREHTDDPFTRTLAIRTDMVHDNPGDDPWETQYDDCGFLASRGLSGKVFFLSEAAQLAIDWQAYDANVFPVGSEGYEFVQGKKEEFHAKYREAKDKGLKVYFMMDFISLPNSMKTLYGDDILKNGKIDVNKPKTQEIMREMMKEIFTEFPEVDGIYPRYGESYVGFYSSYHFGNNPIGVSGTKAADHTTLLRFFRDEVCEKYGKEVVYRTWSTEVGENSFTTSPSLYLQITDAVEPHEKLFIAVKHTAGDFWRNYTFNETIGIGKHRQIIEVQCSREYEGKGAFPNYVAGSVINGFPEYEWQMKENENKCLRDVVNCENSLVAGIWTWSRGGGWGGPYTNGKKNPKGDELWSDLNAYVLHEWAKDTSVTDTSLVKQYAIDVLGMNDADADRFVKLALLSAEGVLYGTGTNSDPAWEPLWTRDSNVSKDYFDRNLTTMIAHPEKLDERRKSVELWQEIVTLAESLDESVEKKEYIVTTAKYGMYFYSICERMWTAGVLSRAKEDTAAVKADYDALWQEWKTLSKKVPACPTLYDKESFDAIIDRFC